MPEESSRSRPLNPVLQELHLSNFKSVREEHVPLAPLTVLVGENSSGKSSILQALLLLQQAARAKVPGANFPLNGSLVRMGTVSDIRTEQVADDALVEIGVDISFPDDFHTRWEGRPSGGRLKWRIALGDVAPDESISTLIKGLTIALESEAGENLLTLAIRHSETKSSIVSVPSVSPWIRPADCDLSLHGELIGSGSDEPIKFVGTALSGAVPSGLLVEQDAASALANTWAERFFEEHDMRLLQERSLFRRIRLPTRTSSEDSGSRRIASGIDDLVASAVRSINSLLEEHGSASDVLSRRLWNDIQLPEMSAELAHEFASHQANDLATKIAQELRLDGQAQLLCDKDEWNEMEYYTSFFEYFVGRNIRYLGPLREAPQIIMSNTPTALVGDIGLRGEFTAAVLQSLGGKNVHTPLPDGEHKDLPLSEAVTRWAVHLELVETVEVEDLAALGLTINVKPAGLDRAVTLPSVGVGVSQLLPVLVLCLLANPGSLILLEQPELHLHPGLQQRLTDFLIAMVRSGRQMIVETHSEYMISRIRRRIASDNEDILQSRVKVIFAERDRGTGFTTYRDIELSPYGDIEEWPKGFFDQAAEEEREIIRAGLEKQAQRSV